MSKKIDNIRVSIEERNEIESNGADRLPLNPTAQGYSGQEVRRRLAKSVTGKEGSVLSLMVDKFGEVEDIINEHQEEIDEIKEFYIEQDIMIGTVDVYTETGPFVGFREIDGKTLVGGDKVLVAGNGQEKNGIYEVDNDGWWTKILDVKTNQVVSINSGLVFGGSMQKKVRNGTTLQVRNPERSVWRILI